MQGNVIGPIDHESWYYMRMLRESIKDHEGNTLQGPKYRLLINAHRDLYKKELRNYI